LFRYIDKELDSQLEQEVLPVLEQFTILSDIYEFVNRKIQDENSVLSKTTTIEDITVEKMKSPWFPIFPRAEKRNNAAVRLICFYHAGGNVNIFLPWLKHLHSNIEVIAVNLPGHQSRISEVPLTSIRQISKQVVSHLLPLLRTKKKFALFGHSFGSLIAYEVSLELKREHQLSPMIFFISGRRAPHLRDPDASELQTSKSTNNNLMFLDLIAQRYQDTSLIKLIQSSPEIVERLLPSLRADMCAFENYVCELPLNESLLDCPIAVFAGDQDPRVNDVQLKEWSKHTKGQLIELCRLPGKHFYFLENLEPLVKKIQFHIDYMLNVSRQY